MESEEKPVFYEPYERETELLSGGVGDYVVRSSGDFSQLRAALVHLLFNSHLRNIPASVLGLLLSPKRLSDCLLDCHDGER